MKQAFCLYVIMFVMFILFTDLFCECAEGFDGKKVSVEYKLSHVRRKAGAVFWSSTATRASSKTPMTHCRWTLKEPQQSHRRIPRLLIKRLVLWPMR